MADKTNTLSHLHNQIHANETNKKLIEVSLVKTEVRKYQMLTMMWKNKLVQPTGKAG